MTRSAEVFLECCKSYDTAEVDAVLDKWSFLFASQIRPGMSVTLKPNWIAASNKYDTQEWQSVITHPVVITSVLKQALRYLRGSGRIVITDGPQTQSSWREIMARMTPDLWVSMGRAAGVHVDVVDLRDDEWHTDHDVIVSRQKLAGDPMGSTECDLGHCSEFEGHQPGSFGYFGADYNKQETNTAHSNGQHRYRVSRSIISSDLFINLPKLKTHKKAGITASLKNLVGINTYKNWLPHHTEGSPEEGGDQFPHKTLKTSVEGRLVQSVRQILTSHGELGRWIAPVKSLSKSVFGDTRNTVRNGSWYGNQTLWRTILDLNKILLYTNPDGSLRPESLEERKPYITIIDAIIAGEGNGPEAPTPRPTSRLIAGTNPVAVDAVCARIMGFDWRKIPSIRKAFDVARYPICEFAYEEIVVVTADAQKTILELAVSQQPFQPHFGWKGHIELYTKSD